jgi:cation transporter-like permease
MVTSDPHFQLPASRQDFKGTLHGLLRPLFLKGFTNMFLGEFSGLEMRGASQKDEYLSWKLKSIILIFLLVYFVYRVASRFINWFLAFWYMRAE